MGALLVTAVVLPVLGALGGVLVRPADGAPPAGRAGTLGAGVGFLAAVVLAVAVTVDGPVDVVVHGADAAAAGLALDRVGALLLLLVLGVGTVVQSFARRYLQGDPRATRFAVLTGLLLTASGAVVAAVTLVGLAAAWTAVSLALLGLLGLYRGSPAADEGVRRAARAFAVGDGALWAAVVLATLTWGTVDLRRLDELPARPAVLAAVALLLVVTAIARSAQVPLQGWLPATLAAPTPVSALLHAGVVNAGGVLLVRTGDLFGAVPAATWTAFVVGAVTTAYGTVLMLVKTDVKGALAHSTMGQMGFMVMTCGLGAYAAAAVHLVAHGMYKATLFLGSGSAVEGHVRAAKAPPRPQVAPGPLLLALAAGIPAAALGLAGWAQGTPVAGTGGTAALLLFAWATGAVWTWAWLRRHPSVPGALAGAGVVLAVAVGYLAVVHAVTAWLLPALPAEAPAAVPTAALVVVALVLAAGWLVVRGRGPAPVHRAREALYARALAHTGGRP